MSVRRYTASAVTTIVYAFQPNLVTRGTGANMGRGDVMRKRQKKVERGGKNSAYPHSNAWGNDEAIDQFWPPSSLV